MNVQRRGFLSAIAWSSIGAWVAHKAHGSELLRRLWPQQAFAADHLQTALTQLYGPHKPENSEQIRLEIPELAEDGAVVPVTVSTTLPGVESIALLAEKNPTPLLAEFILTEGLEPFVSTHVKLAASCLVLAVVRAQGQSYSTQRMVKVMVGGCG
ncbi:MAG: thiosulfate oxidation carrier protein SoxY [Methylococcaceae bacterium]|nr:MAG: thiosulfate oxidation carrier protein SoxY [Methylococcaceae bacterium]